MNYSNMVQRYLLPALKAADLPRVRFHDLRHTNASLRLENGENIKYIQTQLGHANPTITLNVYAHLMRVGRPWPVLFRYLTRKEQRAQIALGHS
jgi:integrase